MLNQTINVSENEKGIAYACINMSEEERMKSSSGGVFTLLAKYVLAGDGKVYGAAFNKERMVCHQGIDDVSDLKRVQGSKYMQSNKGHVFIRIKQDLKDGKIVLFSGTPCEVIGLKNYLGKEYENLICVDVVCHGVPSPLVWREYIAYIEKIVGKPRDRVSNRT